MTPKLSGDVEKFVAANPLGIVKVEGKDGAVYWVFTDEALRVRQLVQEGIDAADRGDVTTWDPEEIKRDGRKRLEERRSS